MRILPSQKHSIFHIPTKQTAKPYPVQQEVARVLAVFNLKYNKHSLKLFLYCHELFVSLLPTHLSPQTSQIV